MSRKDISLVSVMGYDHLPLIQRLGEKLKISTEQAQDLFTDTKRFLYLCGTTAHPLAPTEKIDQCWHEFLLFTKDYAEFCQKFLGTFIHHFPKIAKTEEEKSESTISITLQRAREVFGLTLSPNWAYQGTNCLSDCQKCEGSTNCQN